MALKIQRKASEGPGEKGYGGWGLDHVFAWI